VFYPRGCGAPLVKTLKLTQTDKFLSGMIVAMYVVQAFSNVITFPLDKTVGACTSCPLLSNCSRFTFGTSYNNYNTDEVTLQLHNDYNMNGVATITHADTARAHVRNGCFLQRVLAEISSCTRTQRANVFTFVTVLAFFQRDHLRNRC
jgi:hypothetical protein